MPVQGNDRNIPSVTAGSGIRGSPGWAGPSYILVLLVVFTALFLILPAAAFDVSPANPGAGGIITFSVNDPTGATFVWNFGDGTTGTGNPVTHTYSTAGLYTVNLQYRHWYDNGEFSETMYESRSVSVAAITTITITIVPTVKADFTYSPDSPKVNEPVTFNGGATTDPSGLVNTWRWDFGDGSTGTGKTVVHQYTAGRDYRVTLTVSRSVFSIKADVPEKYYSTVSRTVTVRIPAAPSASFSFSPQNPAVMETVSFDASGSSDSDGYIATYRWDFGDGTPGYGSRVSYNFPYQGERTVSLTVTDNDGLSDSSTGKVTVSPPAIPPHAAFSFSPQKPEVMKTVSFDASGSSDPDGYITSYRWDFGDGIPRSGVRVAHSFPEQGQKAVVLTVTDNDGLSDTGTGWFTVSLPNPYPDLFPWILLVILVVLGGYFFHWHKGRKLARGVEEPVPKKDIAGCMDEEIRGKTEEQKKPSRVVNTRFAAKDSPDTTLDKMIPLKSDTDYYFCFDIGPYDAGTIEKILVDIEIPEMVEDARVLVAIFGFNNRLQINPDADNGELLVQNDGSVTVIRQPIKQIESLPKSDFIKTRLFFPVHTPKEHGRKKLRCNIYYKQILLQSRLVEVLVADKPDGSTALSSELDYTLARSLHPAHFGHFSEHRMSIMMNTGDDGNYNFYLCASDGNTCITDKLDIEPGLFRSAIKMARNTLKIESWGTKEEWKREWDEEVPSPYLYFDGEKDLDRLQKSLFNMAIWGHDIFSLLKKSGLAKFEHILSKPGFVQLAMKNKPSYYFPAAFVYDNPIYHDREDLTLCPTFSDAFTRGTPLEDTACFQGTCTKAKESGGKVICPGGFWGFRHCVSMPLSIEDDVPAEIPFKDTVNISVAISENLKLYGEHFSELKDIKESIAPPTWDYADTFDQIFSSMKKSPQVVYFYCHGGVIRPGDDDQEPYLEIGKTGHPDQIHKTDFLDQNVEWTSPKPLIFLNGCHTAAIDPLTALNFIEPLLKESHCAGVIGTEITIFEDMATVFGQECLRRFLKGEPIGSAVRSARLKVLSKGNPLGLAYIPFVKADLRLKKS